MIFLISSERSGSNLLRLIMNSHSSVCAPSSPHFIQTLMPHLYLYDDSKSRLLLKHFCDLFELRPHGWETTRKNIADLLSGTKATFEDIFTAIYENEASLNQKKTIFIKDNGIINHPYEISIRFPDAKFVYLVRDSRDFVLSWLSSANHPNSLETAARRWKEEQENALNFINCVDNQNRTVLIRYEEILESPEISLTKLCNFAGLEFDNEMLNFNKSAQARGDATTYANWKNLDRPVLKENRGKYLHEMSAKKIRHIESITFGPLNKLGYKIHYKHDRPLPVPGRKADYFSGVFSLLRMIVDKNVKRTEIIDRIQRAKKLNRIRWEAKNLSDVNLQNNNRL